MLKVEIKLEKKDLRAFVRYNLLNNYPIYFLITTFAFFLFNLASRNYPILKKDYIISSTSILVFAVLIFCFYYLMSSIFSGTTKDKKALTQKTYKFTKKELTVYINEAVFPINWKEFSKFKNNKKYFFLYIDNKRAIIIPKRLLDNQEKKELHHILKKAKKKISL